VHGIELERNFAIVKAIVGIAHTLGLPVIAEGVETELQAQCLTSLDCELMQGYHLGRPVDVAEFERRFIALPLSAGR
jgi:EAL domain-containing protein (putative c-di-GMP-specific phosphodiesterase class I)